MAVTLTQEDINAVAQQVLTLIRESGREFNDTPISFTDPFNVAAEERENIKVPAIDERIAGQVKTGSLDLEALLQAYGLTEVQQIASDISTNYIQKNADINMNGNTITNASINVATHMTVGSEGNTYGGYQLSTQEDIDGFVETGKVKWAKISGSATPYSTDGILLSIGWRQSSSYSYARQIFFDETTHVISGRSLNGGTWGAWVQYMNYSGFANVNSMGSSSDGKRHYIRFENGVMIEWGTSTVIFNPEASEEVWGGVCAYYRVPCEFNFLAGGFVSHPRIFPFMAESSTTYIPYKIEGYPSKIANISVWRGATTGASYASFIFSYFAIGEWDNS